MDIPFESFANLIYRLGHPPKSKSSQQPLHPTKIFQSWLTHLPRPFPPRTGKHLFRLLFPHEGSRRRYGLRETKLAVELERILCVSGLTRWDAVGWGQAGSGCLGKEVERVMRDRLDKETKSDLSIRQIDQILDDLAAHSSFSQLSQPPPNFPPQDALLTRLYRDSNLSPYSLCLITQIILRDLRPLLNPLPSLRARNPTAMLRLKSTAGPTQLDLIAAMRCWHPQMPGLYTRGMGDVDLCADTVESLSTSLAGPSCGARVGVNVQIPKCVKGRSAEDALKHFVQLGQEPAAEIWAETKYDGYRMQIHVEIRNQADVSIKIFSKSKRESTADRLNTHAIILSALGLPLPSHLPAHPALYARSRTLPRSAVRSSVILEAEVVPYNEGIRDGNRGPGIEEFWWLGAAGVTADATGPRFRIDSHRHLCLVFFDILHLDGESLLQTPLVSRRRMLEKVLQTVPGFSCFADYTAISTDRGRSHTSEILQLVFDRACASMEEGLVLKAAESTYLDARWRWVKLKKDYIPNLGDCIDLVLLGAGWDPDRARELRVDTSVCTTFYLGVLTNHEAVKAKIETPHFEILFRVSYGLDRDALESVNGNIRHSRWKSKSYDRNDPFKRKLLGLSWTFTMAPALRPPSVLFEQPLCAEVMGAGFQKILGSKYYELRWPRLQKIFEPKERSWFDALTASDLIKTAHTALGYSDTLIPHVSPSGSSRDDSIRALWRSSSAINLTDIPDLPTPSPERPSPRRMRSAPDLKGMMIKSSPPTPVSTGRYRSMGAVAEKLLDSQDGQDKQFGIKREATRGEAETGLEIFASSSPTKRKTKLASPLFGRDKAKRSLEGTDHPEWPSPLKPIEVNSRGLIDVYSHGPTAITEDLPLISLGVKSLATERAGKRSRSTTQRKVLSLRTRISAVLRKRGGAAAHSE